MRAPHAARPRLVVDNSSRRTREKRSIKCQSPLPAGGLDGQQHVSPVRESVPRPPVDDGGLPDSAEKSNGLRPIKGLKNVRNRLSFVSHRGAVYSNGLKVVKPLELELTSGAEICWNQGMALAREKSPGELTSRSVTAIAARLFAFRESQGWDQAELCRRSGIAANTYNQWEKAKGRPELDKAIILRDKFGLPLDWIYLGDAACLPHHIAIKLSPTYL